MGIISEIYRMLPEEQKVLDAMVSTSKRSRSWNENKKLSQMIAGALEGSSVFDINYVNDMKYCSQTQIRNQYKDGHSTLEKVYGCQSRYCPICTARAAHNMRNDMLALAGELQKRPEKYRFAMLTLTVRNCAGNELKRTVEKMYKAFEKMLKKTVFRGRTSAGKTQKEGILKGYIRAFECTYNKHTDTYHPHFHVLLALPEGYADPRSSVPYIQHQEWIRMWREALGVDYDPSVDIRMIKAKNGSSDTYDALCSALVEVAKYPIKDADLIQWEKAPEEPGLDKMRPKTHMNKAKTREVIETMYLAMQLRPRSNGKASSRRYITFGGIFAEIRKLLNQPEDDMAVDVKGAEPEENVCIQTLYGWNWQQKKYLKYYELKNDVSRLPWEEKNKYYVAMEAHYYACKKGKPEEVTDDDEQDGIMLNIEHYLDDLSDMDKPVYKFSKSPGIQDWVKSTKIAIANVSTGMERLEEYLAEKMESRKNAKTVQAFLDAAARIGICVVDDWEKESSFVNYDEMPGEVLWD